MESILYTANDVWVVPPGVTSAVFECIQAGSAGDGGITLSRGGGGGAEGTYARKLVTGLVPGTSHNVVVGQQTGTGAYSSNTPGPTGDASIVYATNGSTELCAARGGVGAGQGGTTANSRIGGAASTTGSVGDSLQAGASGTSAVDSGTSDGGAGGGSTAITGSPTGLTRGAGGNGASSGQGGTGSAPGGGGGGGKGSGGATALGGPGARGIVAISWTSGIKWS